MREEHSAPFGELLATYRTRCRLAQIALAVAMGVHRNTIGRWERGDGLPETRGLVLELAHHLRLDDAETRRLLEASLTALAPYWTVPFPRNPCFTGREDLLRRLHASLSLEQSGTRVPSFALTGLGGIGKTQLALEYAYRHALEYNAVFWLAADTQESMQASLQQAAAVLQLPASHEADQMQQTIAVQRWLTTHRGWLLIGDNVEDLDLLQSVLPAARHGSVLLTTRLQALSTLAEVIDVPPMDEEDGIALMARRAKRAATANSDNAGSEEVEASLPPAERASAGELVALLDGLPLALDQAGAYMEETGCSIAHYLARYTHQRAPLLARRGAALGSHPASVTATVLLAMEHVDTAHPAAAELLRLCAFWSPEAIPEEALLAGMRVVESPEHSAEAGLQQVDHALTELRRFSLVIRSGEMRCIALHRLVQAVLRDHLDEAETNVLVERAIGVIEAEFPPMSFASWEQCERLLPHAVACAHLINQRPCDTVTAIRLLHKMGSYLLQRGRYREAEPHLARAVELGEAKYGHDHAALIPLLMHLGELYCRQGAYSQAEPLCRRALALGERHLGPDHIEIADLLEEVAAVDRERGWYAQATTLSRRALRLRERSLEADHPQVGIALHNLAMLLRDQGLDVQAEPLFLRALAIGEQNAGVDHPEIAATLTQLGALYHRQGKYEQAIAFGARALAIKERQLGEHHPVTATSLRHLANAHRDQGHLDQAVPMYEQALSILEECLGPDHPQTAMVLADLGRLYWYQGHTAQAEVLLRRSLAVCEAQLGREHPKTCLVRSDMETLAALRAGEHA